MLPAATFAVIVASLILGVALVAWSFTIPFRQLRESAFMLGLAFVALSILVAIVQQAFNLWPA